MAGAAMIPDDAANRRLARNEESETADTQGQTPTVPMKPAPAEGRRIGPYTLHAPIGSGSFGVVYLASRDDELRRRVAIKLLRPYMDPAQFRAETQYLALMNHPNIVKVFDFGQTPEGEFYCVMEYVEGLDLTSHCVRQRLDLAGRLRLFHTICQAVRAAHRVPLVHRDLKPDNIRVTAEGEPKLLDFGLARLLQQELALTIKAPSRPGLVAGTWVYASPEQIRGEPVTTATDIYSLGVILYELLTGAIPLAKAGMPLADFSRALMDQTPPPPSRAVQTSEKAAEVAAGMQASNAKAVAAELAGDLDAIVLMALRKEPDRRYPSVEAFAADVRAYLDGFPVSAQPDRWGYRARKLIRRHRAVAAAIFLAVASLTAGLVGTLYQERQAESARAGAQNSLHRMQLESAALQEALDGMVQSNVPTLPQMSQVEQANLRAQQNPADAAARAGLATALQQLYQADEQAGDLQSALSHCRQAAQLQNTETVLSHCQYLEGRTQVAANAGQGAFGGAGGSRQPFDYLGTARNYLALGKLLAAGGDTAAAREAFSRAAVLFGLAPDTAESRQDLAEAKAAQRPAGDLRKDPATSR